MKTILYDGWSLVYQPNSSAALHLLALLEYHPAVFEGVLALPGELTIQIPSSIRSSFEPVTNTSRGQLAWQQRLLTQIAHKENASLIHLSSLTPALLGNTTVIISPCSYPEEGVLEHSGNRPGIWERLSHALGQGGLARRPVIFWPEDLPVAHQPGFTSQTVSLPPFVYPGFYPKSQAEQVMGAGVDLPDTFLLYHGPETTDTLIRLVKAWDWAARPVGDYFPLLVLGLSEGGQARLSSLLREYDLTKTILILPEVSPQEIPLIYRRSKAVFHPASIPAWGGAVRQALASGVAVVAAQDRLTEALVGEAAYLAPAADARTLGAALITVAVEETVAENLARAAARKGGQWNDPILIKQRLEEAYQALLEKA